MKRGLIGLLVMAALVGAMAARPALAEVTGVLSQQRLLDIRCTVIAGVIVSEYERGATKDNRGLARADVERLGAALEAALSADNGIDANTTRLLVQADLELFTDLFARSEPAEAKRALDGLTKTCRPIWTGTRPIAATPKPAATGPDAMSPNCYALTAGIADAMRAQLGRETPESMAFARMAKRIEAQWLASGGDAAALAAALDGFDVAAFDALSETEAENIITKCQTLAGPDK